MFSDIKVDVSPNNGAIDWPSVAAAIRATDPVPFVWIKTSEGTDYVNPQWAPDRLGAEAAGFWTGLYHFGRPSRNSGHAEAAYFLTTIGAAGGLHLNQVLALDLEDPDVAGNADLLAYALDFLGTIERALGIRPFFYSGAWYMAPHNLTGHPELARYPLWLASYQPTLPAPPSPWSHVAIWQYSSSGQVAGIDGPVDLDWINNLDALRPFAWGDVPDPLAGQVVDPPTDTGVDPQTENVTDLGTIFTRISQDARILADRLTDPGLKQAALVIKADADQGRVAAWGH